MKFIWFLLGLQLYFAITASCLLLFLIYRTIKKDKSTHHNHFVVAVHTTPIAAELDPRADEGEENKEHN